MKYALTAAIVLASSLLQACGGGGGSDAPTSQPTEPVATTQHANGYFIDAAVQGLTVVSDGVTSTTDAEGKFAYVDGKSVEFFIGGISLGSAQGALIMTPASLDGDTTDVTSNITTNQLRFLQTLDADGNASNGIQISAEVSKAAAHMTVDFSGTPAQFEARSTTQYALSVLMPLNPNGNQALVSAEQARAHYLGSMASMLGGKFRGGFDDAHALSFEISGKQVTAFAGALPNGSNITGTSGAFDTDGSLAVSCDQNGTSSVCYRMTVVKTDGASVTGRWVDVVTGTAGVWTAGRMSSIGDPKCNLNPAICI